MLSAQWGSITLQFCFSSLASHNFSEKVSVVCSGSNEKKTIQWYDVEWTAGINHLVEAGPSRKHTTGNDTQMVRSDKTTKT